jgi:hypothetical protein
MSLSSNAVMHWLRDGYLFFLIEESKFPYYLLSCLSIISQSSLI